MTDKRSEDDWFRQHEETLLAQARREREARERQRTAHGSEDQRSRLREAHWMKCPKCGHDLATEDFSGVAIDRCTFCEGIYFDAGEFEELIQKRYEDRRNIVRRMLGI